MGYAVEDRNLRAELNALMMQNVLRMHDYEHRRRPRALARRPDEHCIVIVLPRLPLASSESGGLKLSESSRRGRAPAK